MGSVTEFYEAWADFYDPYYGEQEIGDLAFYRELAADADGPVLEVGCGTGRVYLEVLSEGVDIDGIDLSADMLAVLERKAAERDLEPSVWQADMRAFEPDREYALITIPFRVFLHNLTVADQVASLDHLRSALEPGGCLVFNVFVPSFDVICETYGSAQEEVIEHEGDEYTIVDHTRILDEVEQTVESTRRVEQEGELVDESRFRLALISKREFELLFELTGWSDWEGYGGFDREPLEEGAKEMVWILEK